MLEALKGKRVLVTGGAGFIGSHTVDRLLASGATVLAYDNLATGILENLNKAKGSTNFRFEEGDVAQAESFAKIVSSYRPDAILHLAALVSVQESIQNPGLNFERNVYATHAVIEAARLSGAPRIVFASSAAIFGDNPHLPLGEDSAVRPLSPYGAAKLASENLLSGAASTYRLNVISNRYFNVYGPRQDPKSPYSGVMSIFYNRFRQGQPITLFGDGKQTRDFIFVRDVAEANCRALASKLPGNEAFNICTGVSTSLLDLLSVFKEHFPDAPPACFAAARTGDIIHSLGNPSKAQRLLGFEAKTTIRSGLSIYLDSEVGTA